jgi:DNA-binding response OmpR family regulator
VEDNPADAGIVREALEEHGVEGELTVLIDGEMAIQFVQDIDSQLLTSPDLIIVDLNLPRKPGREVLGVHPKQCHLPLGAGRDPYLLRCTRG